VHAVLLVAGEGFLALFPVVEPFNGAATFLALTARHSHEERRREARLTVITVASILLVFLLVGEPLLHYLGISLESLQIAGGIVVGYTGFKMVTESTEPHPASAQGSVAFAPMAIPLLAGPGALSVLLGLDAWDSGASRFPGLALGVVAIVVVLYLFFTFGGRLIRFLGEGGLDALNRVLGLFVLAIGVELIVHGIVNHPAGR
jgi:multiple antibiotic resistance protein